MTVGSFRYTQTESSGGRSQLLRLYVNEADCQQYDGQ